MERGLGAAVDKRYLGRPEVRTILVESLSDAFLSGSRGPAWETGLNARPWGFRLEDISTPVYLSHGEQDANAPVALGRYLASVIPKCQATFYPEEGHLHFVDRLPDIYGSPASFGALVSSFGAGAFAGSLLFGSFGRA